MSNRVVLRSDLGLFRTLSRVRNLNFFLWLRFLGGASEWQVNSNAVSTNTRNTTKVRTVWLSLSLFVLRSNRRLFRAFFRAREISTAFCWDSSAEPRNDKHAWVICYPCGLLSYASIRPRKALLIFFCHSERSEESQPYSFPKFDCALTQNLPWKKKFSYTLPCH